LNCQNVSGIQLKVNRDNRNCFVVAGSENSLKLLIRFNLAVKLGELWARIAPKLTCELSFLSIAVIMVAFGWALGFGLPPAAAGGQVPASELHWPAALCQV
jgi:hypothetical protein